MWRLRGLRWENSWRPSFDTSESGSPTSGSTNYNLVLPGSTFQNSWRPSFNTSKSGSPTSTSGSTTWYCLVILFKTVGDLHSTPNPHHGASFGKLARTPANLAWLRDSWKGTEGGLKDAQSLFSTLLIGQLENSWTPSTTTHQQPARKDSQSPNCNLDFCIQVFGIPGIMLLLKLGCFRLQASGWLHWNDSHTWF